MQNKHISIVFILLLIVLLICLAPALSAAELQAHFIDVGQGDSILIQCDGEFMLIDAGPQEAGKTVNDYLLSILQSKALKYVVATHSHDDHLFGMPDALKGLSVNTVYSGTSISMTYWFSEILPKHNNKSITVLTPQEMESFQLGNAEVAFVNTRVDSDNINNHSLACKIVYGSTSLLLTADIEGEAEISMLEAGIDLEADILKVAHHGGNTSSCDAFLNAVKPKYAIISVGAGNPHGHPHQVVLDRLAKRNILVYRTDFYGTIIATSDGQEWTIEVKKAR